MSQPSPDEQLRERLRHLTPAALRILQALDEAQQQARDTGERVVVSVQFEVTRRGLVAVTVPTRVERRVESCGGAT